MRQHLFETLLHVSRNLARAIDQDLVMAGHILAQGQAQEVVDALEIGR